MNLAEIRKKAQKGESGETPREDFTPAWHAACDLLEPFPPESAPAEATAPQFPAPEFDQPVVSEVSEAPWRAEPAVLRPAEPEWTEDDAGEFDPAAVILKGREAASFEVEVSQLDEVAATTVELLCFRVADEEYAINIMDIKEIIKPREVTEVPRVPGFVRGILSLRGNIIPIFDMRVRLGLSSEGAMERERVVVVKRQGGFAGVLVDEVVQVVRVPEGGIEPPPVVLEGIDREFVLGIGRVSGRMVILLDMEKVLDVGLL